MLAAQLAELRSRRLLLLLLEDAPGRSAQADAEALRRRLLSRAETGAVADWLERRPQLGRDVFAKGRPDSGLEILAAEEAGRPMRVQGGRGDITELLRACLVTLRMPEGAGSDRRLPIPLWTVTQAIARVQQQIGAMPDRGALEVFLPRVRGRRAGPRAALQGGARQHAASRAGAGPQRRGDPGTKPAMAARPRLASGAQVRPKPTFNDVEPVGMAHIGLPNRAQARLPATLPAALRRPTFRPRCRPPSYPRWLLLGSGVLTCRRVAGGSGELLM